MTKRKLKLTLLVSALVLFFFLVTANRPLEGQDADFETVVKQKLEQVLQNQQKILTQIDALKEEINKVRIWNR